MSKLLSTLEKLSRGSPAPMGFGAARPAKTPAMALIGLVSADLAANAQRLSSLGADAAMLPADGADAQFAAAVKALDSTPWGVIGGALSDDAVKALGSQDCDFFVVSPDDISVEAIKDSEADFLLSLPAGAQDSYLRAIEDLPVGAVFMTLDGGGPMTLKGLIDVGSVRTMFDKFLLVKIPASASAKELEGLRDMGVDAVVIDASEAGDDELKSVKESLLNMPRQKRPRSDRPDAVLPLRMGFSSSADEQDDDWEDE